MADSGAAPLDLVCAADAAYAMPLAAMLRSVDAHLEPSFPLRVFAIDDGLSPADRDRVGRSLSTRVDLRWTMPCWSQGARLPTWGSMPTTTYQKLALGETLPPEVGRAIWLDCDLLVTTDLRALWREPLDGNCLLAVQDRRVPTVGSRFGVGPYREYGLTPEVPYFNAGVMLLDLAAWRAESVGRRALAYLERWGEEIAFWDQEALNAVLAQRWRRLDPRWNIDPTLETLLGPETGRGEPGEAWILHFTGRLKPWTYGAISPAHALYFRHLDETAWTGWRPPRSIVRGLLARYARSGLRRRLHGLEAPGVALWRALTRRSQSVG